MSTISTSRPLQVPCVSEEAGLAIQACLVVAGIHAPSRGGRFVSVLPVSVDQAMEIGAEAIRKGYAEEDEMVGSLAVYRATLGVSG